MCEDGASTKPLDLVLCQWPKNVDYVGYDSPLSLCAENPFMYEGKEFISLLQAIEYEKAMYHNKLDLACELIACKMCFNCTNVLLGIRVIVIGMMYV